MEVKVSRGGSCLPPGTPGRRLTLYSCESDLWSFLRSELFFVDKEMEGEGEGAAYLSTYLVGR